MHDPTTTQRLSVLRPDSIRSKILTFAVLATLLPSLATAWFSYMENKRSLTARASEELMSVSAQTARELDLWTKERRYDLRVFASSYEVTENLENGAAASSRARQRLTEYLDSVRERFADYDELRIVDATGRVVAASGTLAARENATRSSTVALPDGWQAQVRGDNLVLGAPFWNAANQQPQMLVAVPIGVGEGRFLGAIAATVNLQTLAATLKRFAPRDSGHVYLLTAGGKVIVSSRQASAEAMALRFTPEAMRTRLAREGRSAEFTSVSGETVVGSMRSVPGVDWVVVAEFPAAEVFRQLERLRNVTLLIVAGMLGVAGGLGYALGLFIVRPLNRLAKGAAKVAAGDLDVDLPAGMGGEVGYLTEIFNNMVARVRASREELERLSVTDPLTGLNNRRRMMEVLENEVRRSRRLKHPFAVLMADVDHFKQFNDAHGHPAGDEVLKRVAAILQETTRDVDFVARYGGEEFLVLMPELTAQGAAEVVDRIRQRIGSEPGLAGTITLSCGVAEFPAHGDSGTELIKVADDALYQAKRDGRDRVVVVRVPPYIRVAGE